jgi:hypothetical protein
MGGVPSGRSALVPSLALSTCFRPIPLLFTLLRTLYEKHPGVGCPLRRIACAHENAAAEFVSSLSPYFISSLLPYVQKRRRPSRSDGAAAKRACRLQERRPFDGKFNSRVAVAAPPSCR